MKQEKIVVIDGNSLMNRAFYAIPPLTNSEGLHTNAVYGFTNMIFKIVNDEMPDFIFVAFDRKAPTFRHIEYSDYKAGRKKMPAELGEQFPLVKDILRAFKIGIYEIDGYEADDIIGTVSKTCEKKGMEVLIYTGDRDALQLVSDKVKVAITKKGITEMDIYDEKAFEEKYQVMPGLFIDIKGLMGDQSDNIPGVPGIGEKTAIKLVKEFGTVEEIIKSSDRISSNKVKELIDNYKEQAIFSKRLSTIVKDAPIEFNLEEISIKHPDNNTLLELFKKLEFKSLINKIPSNEDAKTNNRFAIKEYQSIGMNDIEGLIEKIHSSGRISLVFDTRGSDFYNTDIEGIGISWDGEDAAYIPDDNELIFLLKEIFEDPNIKKICHNAKDIYVSLYKHNIKFRGLEFDTAIGSYLLNPSENTYNVDELASKYLGISIPSDKEVKELIKGNDLKISSSYLCSKSIFIYKMSEIIKEHLKNNDMMHLYKEVEHPLIEVLSSMEIEGFTVDEDILKRLSKEFGNEIVRLTDEIYNLAEENFNINSPKQLGNILFEKLKLPVVKKTKTGYSTDAEVLEKLAPQHEIVDKILEYRQIMKLKSTYVDGLLNRNQ